MTPDKTEKDSYSALSLVKRASAVIVHNKFYPLLAIVSCGDLIV